MTSEATTTNVFLRNDTIFGVCQAIGDDFGINANWVRIPLAAIVLFSPVAAVVAYFGLGILVLASRLLFRGKAPAAAEPVALIEPHAVEANDDDRERIAA